MIDSRIRRGLIHAQTASSPRSVACGPPQDDRKIGNYLANRVKRLQLEARAEISPCSAMILDAQRSKGAASSSKDGQTATPGIPSVTVDPHSFFSQDDPSRQ
eukprot:2170103-Karenia_brevis.AAC.1